MVRGNGLRSGSNTLIVDGAAQNEVWEGWDVARQPSLDAVEELRVEVNNASAKFSRPTSVIMSTRSGTNQVPRRAVLYQSQQRLWSGTTPRRYFYQSTLREPQRISAFPSADR